MNREQAAYYDYLLCEESRLRALVPNVINHQGIEEARLVIEMADACNAIAHKFLLSLAAKYASSIASEHK